MSDAHRLTRLLFSTFTALITVFGVLWVLNLPQRFGWALVSEELLPVIIGLATGAALLARPYRERAGMLEWLLAVLALACWTWSALNYDPWVQGFADRTLDKWLPGTIALLLMLEALRKTCGRSITTLVWAFIIYALVAHLLPGALGAERQSLPQVVMYLYADSQGVPGSVLNIVITLVMAFVLLGRLMEDSGVTRFFTDLAMSGMAHRRGGPAKVSVIASSGFGMVSGSTVGNIMSTGIVTIPLMKKAGFPPRYAAAIEAVASNGGQIAPPVMGATAFLIAEFLQIDYVDVVLAALLPAVVYYLVLFLEVDGLAARLRLAPGRKGDQPPVGDVLVRNWLFVIPIALLLYLLFGLGWDPALSALITAVVLFVFVAGKRRALPSREQWHALLCGSGQNLLPLLLIAGGAGIVIGVLNSTGTGFQLTLALAQLGHTSGMFVMLLVTSVIAIILGMGMPTAAVYLVLSVVLAPVFDDFGVAPIAVHMFLFYFGVLSMLTPPVAVASYVAAGLAETDFWTTSVAALRLSLVAYLLPFLWIYNPALLMQGSAVAIILVVVTTVTGALALVTATALIPHHPVRGLLMLTIAIGAGSATLWLGHESWWNLLPALVALAAARTLRNAQAPLPVT
ncbi:MAG: TRAP transporter fused permease subunit [Gammaproteobacteria bacterium]|nr:TRAP transporter fused permease subunit [Gammaproteobacteria bacterium]